jgi:hypothetical protein
MSARFAPVAIDVKKLTDQQVRNLIENHVRKHATSANEYLEALAELGRREGHGLEFDKTMEIVREAARRRNFVSYKALAKASNVDFNKVRFAINGHLWRLVDYAHHRKWPLLSAVVVNQPNVETGEMEASTLRGFIAAARLLQYTITDEHAFLKEQQERVFEWAQQAIPSEA